MSASIAPQLPASQIGAWTPARRTHGSTSSQVRRVQSRTTCLSSCQAVGSPVTLPTMNPTSGQPTRQVSAMTTA